MANNALSEGCKMVCIAVQAIPIALLHPIFGMFQDIFAGKSGPLLQSDYVMAVRTYA